MVYGAHYVARIRRKPPAWVDGLLLVTLLATCFWLGFIVGGGGVG